MKIFYTLKEGGKLHPKETNLTCGDWFKAFIQGKTKVVKHPTRSPEHYIYALKAARLKRDYKEAIRITTKLIVYDKYTTLLKDAPLQEVHSIYLPNQTILDTTFKEKFGRCTRYYNEGMFEFVLKEIEKLT